MTEYKQLCAELVSAVDRLLGQGESPANPGQRLILTVHVEDLGAIADRARAALAQPEPKGLTDDELDELFIEIDQSGEPESWRAYARAVLACWGNHPGSPDRSTPQPVPVSERLPGPGDCDAEGLCWVWNSTAYTWGMFRLDRTVHSHWLPAHALPLPPRAHQPD